MALGSKCHSCQLHTPCKSGRCESFGTALGTASDVVSATRNRVQFSIIMAIKRSAVVFVCGKRNGSVKDKVELLNYSMPHPWPNLYKTILFTDT